MDCVLCASQNQVEFSAEIYIPFRNPKNIDEPGIFAFQTIVVCLDCGFSRFFIPKSELARLAIERSTRDGFTFEGNASEGSHALRNTFTA